MLIPAFRPTYLRQAIASVLTQGWEDYELVISDDSGGEAVQAVVECFSDQRIRYRRTAGRTGADANLRALWNEAAHDHVKFLFDDDLLLPNALVELLDAAGRFPDASLVFGHRDVIDADGRILDQPRLVAPDKIVALSAGQVSESLLKGCHNRIGELSNVLINRARGVNLDDVLQYRGIDLMSLGDVALYLNASWKGPVVGVGRTVGQFRRHGAQLSSWTSNKHYFKTVAEWELFIRGECGAGVIDAPTALAAATVLDRLYGIWEGRLPELSLLRGGIPDLRERISAGDKDLLDDRFLACWAAMDDLCQARIAAGETCS